ncbi:MAG: magnesium transporter [Nitrospinota bacterium]
MTEPRRKLERTELPNPPRANSHPLSSLHPADIADYIEQMDEENRNELFSRLNMKTASNVLLEMHEHPREQLLETMDRQDLVHMVEEMDSNDAAEIIRDLPENEADSLLKNLKKVELEEVQQVLRYQPDSAGGIMQVELFSVRAGMLIEDVVVQFIASSDEPKDIPMIYVIDAVGKLVGTLHVGELLRHKPVQPVVDVMDKEFVFVTATEDQEDVARIFKKYDAISLPVLDDGGKLLGHILVDDVVDVMHEEASEDMLRIAGIYDYENVFASPLTSVRLRFPWLVLNLATAAVAASIIGLFEETIKNLVILAVLMPIVAGMGGNAGTQALTVTIRGLALGELTRRNGKQVIMKGFLVGLMNGFIVGILMGVISYLWEGNLTLSAVMFAAMVLNLIVANLFGILIPLFLKKIRIDPAIASSVFLTSLTDSIGFISFLGLSKIFLDSGS